MDKGRAQDNFSCPVAQIDERTSWVVEGVVRASRILVFLRGLDPLERETKRFKEDLSVGQPRFQLHRAVGFSLSLRFLLAHLYREVLSQLVV